MQICEKMMDDKIDTGPEEHNICEVLQEKLATICNENLDDTTENEKKWMTSIQEIK